MRRVWNKLFDLTGFRGKTLWDLMSLLIVPLVILGATGVLNYFENQRENRRADALQEAENQRADALRKADIERADALVEAESRHLQAQQQIEDDRVRQNVLQSYIQDMTALLLDKGLATSESYQPVRNIARSSTLTTVRQLDADRKGILLQFLYESNLITKADPIIRLSGANLSGANLSNAILSGVNLEGAHLDGVNLSNAHLDGANLSNAHLLFANLSGTILRGANLGNTDLSGDILLYVDESVSGANLRGVHGWTNEQLARAASLVGATLPDGTVMTEEAWEEFKKQYRAES